MPEVPIRMPKMSMTMEEGEFNNWLISVGDTITKGQPVAVVMTDKVEMEVESEVEGTVTRLTAQEGDTIAVGGELGYVESAERRGPRRPQRPARLTRQTDALLARSPLHTDRRTRRCRRQYRRAGSGSTPCSRAVPARPRTKC